MTKEEMAAWAARLSVKATRARSRSRSLQAEVAKVARQVSETEEALAARLDSLALQCPQHAERLQGMGGAVRAHAARERQRLHRYLATPAGNDGAG